MKTRKMMLIVFLVLISLTAITFSDEVKMSGSNQNTIINLVELFPYQPDFGTNLTIRANVTDEDSIQFVNFSIISPNGNYYVSHLNGTKNGSFWNSSVFTVNETGIWDFLIESDDNNTLNTTITSYQANFTITDVLTIDTTNITTPFATNQSQNKTWIIAIKSDSVETIPFNITSDLEGKYGQNFTVLINQTPVYVNNSKFYKFNITIRTNATANGGNYSGNLSITRASPFQRQWNLSINLEVTENVGDIELVNDTDYTFTSCGTTVSLTYNLTNLGTYPVSSCHPFFLDSNNNEVGTSVDEGFSIAAGADRLITMDYNYPGSEDKELTFDVSCIATSSGTSDALSGDKPLVTINLGSNCGTTSGGGGTDYEPPKPPVNISAQNITGLCGNGMCEAGESPWNCPKDCLERIWDLDQVFCSPIFKCGNWNESWFINGMIILTIGGLVYFQYKSIKVKRKI